MPHTDTFCRVTSGTQWAAYSWLFELVLFGLFKAFGLAGVVIYTMAVVFAITLALYNLTRRHIRSNPAAVATTFLLCFSMGHLYTPRPWLLSILFFAIELNLLVQAKHRICSLFWLPPLFTLWANVHIQFVDGLLVLGFFCADTLLKLLRKKHLNSHGVLISTSVLLLALMGTLCNPYGWHIYEVAWTLASEPGVLNQLQELQSLPFRDCIDWLILAIAMVSVISVTKERRLSFFRISLLTFACVSAFRSQRDVWLLAVSATSLVRRNLKRSRVQPEADGPVAPLAGSATVALIVILLGFFWLGAHNDKLEARLATVMPVKAVEQVKKHRYRGPVFNDYQWGGYLMWTLQSPVSLDGRAGLHGEPRIQQSIDTWTARDNWVKDPQLADCGYVIAPRQAALTQVLRLDPRFWLAYQDQVAAIFLRR